MYESYQFLLEPRVRRFEDLLPRQQLEAFKRTSLVDVKRHIIAMQRNQDQKKTLMDLSRLQAFIEAMSQFTLVCEDVEMDRPELSCFIWGPLMFILRVSRQSWEAAKITIADYSRGSSPMSCHRPWILR